MAVLAVCSCGRRNTDAEPIEQNDSIPALGFWKEDFYEVEGKVGNGETFTGLMTRFGLSSSDAYRLAQLCDTTFDVRKVRAGNPVKAYYKDSLERTLQYLVYDKDRIRSTVFQCADSLALWTYDKPVTIERKVSDITIQTSLWNDMLNAGASPLLILELADIYAWTVDFFGLQGGDRFRAVYDQRMVDGEMIDISKVDFGIFSRDGKDLYAIRCDQGDGGNVYWNEKGESMKKAFLKAPLKFTRISSRFSYHRKHPVSGVVKAHTAVDYAAPTGTPVMALGDGTVISVGWAGGGGNTVKIRHNSVYTTSYMHLSKYGAGIKSGVHVRQGQVIGYVGATGTATGPHLDFRVYKNGTAIDPLKLESPSAEPIRQENMPRLDSLFQIYRAELLAATDSTCTQ